MKYIFTIWKGWSRFIRTHKLQSAACVIGLSLGMTCYAMSMLWLRHIESFENFAPDAERLYIVGNKQSDYSGLATYNCEGYFAKYLVENYPEIETSARFYNRSVKKNIGDGEPYGTMIEDVDFLQVDPEFLDLYGMKAIEGSTGMVENECVITRRIAVKLFGNEPAVGKRIILRNPHENAYNDVTFTIKGIIENWHSNSQFKGDVFALCAPTVSTGGFGRDFRWSVLFKVRKGTNIQLLELKIREDIIRQAPEIVNFAPDIMPLRKLRSHYPKSETDVNLSFVRIFMLLGILVIFTSLCNFVVTTINNMRIRSRNIMLHHLIGGTTAKIIILNALDTLMIFLLSAGIGSVMIIFFLPTFREYSQINLSAVEIFTDIFYYLALVTIGGLAISSIATYIVVRGDNRSLLHGHRSNRSSSKLDRISMVVQFTMAIAIIICTISMMLQIHYLTNTDALGFTRQDIVAIGPCTSEMEQKILSSANVNEYISRSPTVFPVLTYGKDKFFTDKAVSDVDSLKKSLSRFTITPEMIKFWELEIKEGTLPTPMTEEILINETACKILGLLDPIGKEIYDIDSFMENNTNIRTHKITGVIADIYTVPPTQKPNPAIYSLVSGMKEQPNIYSYENYFLSVKSSKGHKKELLDSISAWVNEEKEKYGESNEDLSEMFWYTSGEPIDVEAEYNKLIYSEMLLVRLLRIIAFCCIVVCLIGAYSTIALSLQERRKEIALRKIHGAKSNQIVNMFMRSYALSLAISTAIAAPITIIIMIRWLNNFQKHIVFPYWLLIGVPAALMLLTYATIFHRVKTAAKENPAKNLKSE